MTAAVQFPLEGSQMRHIAYLWYLHLFMNTKMSIRQRSETLMPKTLWSFIRFQEGPGMSQDSLWRKFSHNFQTYLKVKYPLRDVSLTKGEQLMTPK